MKFYWVKCTRSLMVCLMISTLLLLATCQNNNVTTEVSQPVNTVDTQPPIEEESSNTMGTVHIEDFEGRDLYIYLPANYQTSDNRYPVVYMHDGQNVFDVSTSGYGKEWEVDEVLDRLRSQGTMKDVIVVAVAHGGPSRPNEYVSFMDPYIPTDGVTAEAFTKYFIEKVIPYVDETYRTIPDRDNRMIMGSSFAGVQAFWMGYNHPEVFSAIGVVSPATWVANGRLVTEMEKVTDPPDINIWLDTGVTETGMEIEPLVDALLDQGFVNGKNLFYFMDKDGQHDELSWAKRVHNPLLMFGGDSPKQAMKMEVNDYMTTLFLDGARIRINPIVTMDNGMSFTASRLATYEVLNPESGKVDSNGNVTFLKPEPFQVEVSCLGLRHVYTMDYIKYENMITDLLHNGVLEKQDLTYKLLIKPTAEKINQTDQTIVNVVKSLESTGIYSIEESTTEYFILKINRSS